MPHCHTQVNHIKLIIKPITLWVVAVRQIMKNYDDLTHKHNKLMQRRICEAAHVARRIERIDFWDFFSEQYITIFYIKQKSEIKLGRGRQREKDEIMFDSYHKLPEHNNG